jgi:putative membrane protein insertion efficiency factor
MKRTWPQWMLLRLIRVYQVLFSPALTVIFGPLGMGCRFEPTCSRYAQAAVEQHGAWRGSWLAVRRLGRCHPWGGSGHDPVPPSPQAGPDLVPTKS